MFRLKPASRCAFSRLGGVLRAIIRAFGADWWRPHVEERRAVDAYGKRLFQCENNTVNYTEREIR
ncbi:MAG: hypothetical protein ACK5PY_00695, partial [bacterium]